MTADDNASGVRAARAPLNVTVRQQTKPNEVTVKLTKPMRGHRSMVEAMTFREPRFADYMLLGDPRAAIIQGDKVYMRAIPETVGQYAERLLVKDGEANVSIMEGLGLDDTLAVEKAILGFFQPLGSGGQEETKTMETRSSSSDVGSLS